MCVLWFSLWLNTDHLLKYQRSVASDGFPSASMSVVGLSGERHNKAVNGDARLPMAYGSCSVTKQKTKAWGWTSISLLRSIFGGPQKSANNIFFVQYDVRAYCKNTGYFPTPLKDSCVIENIFVGACEQAKDSLSRMKGSQCEIAAISPSFCPGLALNKTKNTSFPLYTTFMAPRGEKGQWKWRAVNSIRMQLLWKMQFCESLNLTGCSEPNNRKMQCAAIQSSH